MDRQIAYRQSQTLRSDARWKGVESWWTGSARNSTSDIKISVFSHLCCSKAATQATWPTHRQGINAEIGEIEKWAKRRKIAIAYWVCEIICDRNYLWKRALSLPGICLRLIIAAARSLHSPCPVTRGDSQKGRGSSGTLGQEIYVWDNFHLNFICRWPWVFTGSENAVTKILSYCIMATADGTPLVKKMLRRSHFNFMWLNLLTFI